MKKLNLLNTFGVSILTFFTVSANATIHVLDFDTDANNQTIVEGQVIDDEYADWGVTISSCNYNENETTVSDIENCDNNDGWTNTQSTYNTLRRLSDGALDEDLIFIETSPGSNQYESEISGLTYDTVGLPSSFSNRTNPGNVMILNENEFSLSNSDGVDVYNSDKINDQGKRAAGYFTLDFDFAVTLKSIDFFDVEDENNQNLAFYAIQFFDANGVEFGPSTQVETMNDSEWRRASYNIMGVYSIRINLPGSGGIDNIAFEAVNAPATFLLSCFALCAVYRRRIR